VKPKKIKRDFSPVDSYSDTKSKQFRALKPFQRSRVTMAQPLSVLHVILFKLSKSEKNAVDPNRVCFVRSAWPETAKVNNFF